MMIDIVKVIVLASFLALTTVIEASDLTKDYENVNSECVETLKQGYSHTLKTYVDKSHSMPKLDPADECYRAWYKGEILGTHLIFKAIDEVNEERNKKARELYK